MIPDSGPSSSVAAIRPAAPPESQGGETPPPLSSHSRFVQRLRRRYAAELRLLPPGAPTRAAMGATFALLRQQGHDTGTGLRILRQLVMERLVSLDCDAQAPLATVTTAVTDLA